MWPFFPRKPHKNPPPASPPPPTLPTSIKPRRQVRIPPHFQKHPVVTYSQAEIQRELRKYPRLLRILGYAYQYQITFAAEGKETQYWFCRNLRVATILIKYLHDKQWPVHWQEKPFKLKS